MNEEFLNGLGLDKETSDLIIKEYEDEKLRQSIASELKSAGTVDEKAAKALLDTDGLSSENLKERIDALKSAHPALFKTSQPRFISSAERKAAVDKSEFARMSYRDRLELFKKNPDVYKRLVE